VLLALKVRSEDLNSVYRVRKNNLEIDYIPFSCPVVSAEMRGKSQRAGGKLKVRSTMSVTVDLNSNSALNADFTELNFGKPRNAT